MKRRNLFLIGFFFLASSLFACYLFKGEDSKASAEKTAPLPPNQIQLTPEQKNSPLIRLTPVTIQTLNLNVDVLGAIASDTEQVLQLRPETLGRLEQILTGVGDIVEKGQVLARYRTGNGQRDLKAPQKGMVMGIYAEKGDIIEPVVPFLTLADVSKLRCVFDVFEKEIGKIQKGQEVTLNVAAFPDTVFHGTVSYISPRVNENTRTVKVGADVLNPEGKLKFGMFATGRIKVGALTALVVPESAIQEIDKKSSVFVLIQPNLLELRPIETGEKVDGSVEAKSGLKEGETIVSQGSFILKSGLNRTE